MNTPGEPSHLTDEMVCAYWHTLVHLFDAYHSGYAHRLLGEVQQWLQQLEQLQPQAETCAQRIHLLALHCWSHQLASGLARDQEEVESVTFHADRALELAEQAMAEPSPEEDEQAWLPLPHVLVVAALLWRADVSYELGEELQGKADLERVLALLPALHEVNACLRGITKKGILYVQQTPREMERLLLFSCYHLTLHLNALSPFRSAAVGMEELHACEQGVLLLPWEEAMNKPAMRRTESELLAATVMIVRQVVTPLEQVRLHTSMALFLAVCAFAAGNYQRALDFAPGALEKSRLIRSRPYRDRIAALYQQLQTASRDEPSVASLGEQLRRDRKSTRLNSSHRL